MDVQLLKSIRSSIKSGHTQEFLALIERHPDALDATTAFGSWLHVAASFGQLDIVRNLVEEFHVDINKEGGISDGGALDGASGDGHYDVVKYLLDKGAKLDTSPPHKNPLFAAIYGNHLEIGKLLLEAGIDKDVKYSGKHGQHVSNRFCSRARCF